MSSEPLSRRRALQLLGATVTGSLAGCTSSITNNSSANESDSSAVSESDSTATNSNSEYAQVYQETVTSVVLVETNLGQGTGFVYDENHLVTNEHVIENSTSVDVRFQEGEWRSGTVSGTDVYSDLAVIQIDDKPEYATPLSFVEDEVAVGDQVLVIGNPYGLDGTLTTGVVSGVNRSITSATGYDIPDAIQTDAAANPGNSGGPIVSLDGDVIAVINSGGGDNIAFGISAALAQRVIPSLVETGSYDHAYMGVSLADVTADIATANNLDDPTGVIVERVRSGGPSDGVLRSSTSTTTVDQTRVPVGGDIILALNDTEIASVNDLSNYLALEASPDETISVTIIRNGQQDTVELTLGVRPTN